MRAVITEPAGLEMDGRTHPPPGAVPRSREWRTELAVLVAFLVAALYVTWPLAAEARTRTAGGGDPLLNAWLYQWGAHALAHQPLHLFDANIFHPEGLTLAFTENMLGQSLPLAPLMWVTGNGVLAVNVSLLLMFAAGGYGVYLLARELGASWAPALLGGLLFTFAPYRLGQIAHPHVVAIHAIPFALICLVRLRTRPSRWLPVAFGGLVAFQFWASLSGGVILLFAVAAWGLWEVLRHRRGAWPVLVRAGAGLGVALVLIVPLLVPYMIARDQHPEYQHAAEETMYFSASLSSWVSPGPGGPLVLGPNRWLEDLGAEEGDWEKHLFPGLTAMAALALAGSAVILSRSLRRRRPTGGDTPGPGGRGGLGLAAGLVLTGFVLSLGPRWQGDPDGLRLPYEIVTRVIPGNLLRVPARFGTLAPIGIGLAVALLVTRLGRPWARVAVAVLLVALALELRPSQVPMLPTPRITAAHRAVADLPGAVLSLPAAEVHPDGAITSILEQEPANTYLSTAHFRPMVNGYSAFFPTSFVDLMKLVRTFPDAASVRALLERGVTTVVIDTARAEGTAWATAAERLDRWPGVRLAARSDEVRVYDIAAAARAGSASP